MKRIMSIRVAVIVFAGLFALSVVPNAQAACSNKDLKGSFGMIWTGTRIDAENPGPRAGVGLLIADGNGGFSSSATKSTNGTIIEVTGTGTYTVNSDCTGSGAVTDSDGEVRSFNFVIIPLPQEVLCIQTDPGRVVTITLTKRYGM
jgi:hypothetical protein